MLRIVSGIILICFHVAHATVWDSAALAVWTMGDSTCVLWAAGDMECLASGGRLRYSSSTFSFPSQFQDWHRLRDSVVMQRAQFNLLQQEGIRSADTTGLGTGVMATAMAFKRATTSWNAFSSMLGSAWNTTELYAQVPGPNADPNDLVPALQNSSWLPVVHRRASLPIKDFHGGVNANSGYYAVVDYYNHAHMIRMNDRSGTAVREVDASTGDAHTQSMRFGQTRLLLFMWLVVYV